MFFRRVAVASVSAGAFCAWQYSTTRSTQCLAQTTQPVTQPTQTTQTIQASPNVPLSQKYDLDWDKQGAADNVGKGTRYVVLVRHGQYVHGKTDQEKFLTPLGRDQASATGKRLQALLEGGQLPPVHDVVYSTMTRATETAKLVAEELACVPRVPLTPCDLIQEAAVCPPEPEHLTWLPSPRDFLVEGARADAGFAKHIHRAPEGSDENYTTLLICHGNITRYFTMRMLQLAPEAWLRTSVSNGSITVLSIRPTGNCSLETFGNNGHLEPSQVTFN